MLSLWHSTKKNIFLDCDLISEKICRVLKAGRNFFSSFFSLQGVGHVPNFLTMIYGPA